MATETTFGVWLRQQRRQLDWTQVELAQRVGYSVATIRKLERDELRPSKRLAELLAQALDVATTQHASLVNFARTTPTPPLEPVAQPLHAQRRSNLPAQLTPFFGRTAEIVELTQYLTNPTTRLITIVGPGGMGKTRLALEVAQSIYDLQITNYECADPTSNSVNRKYADGVYFVALAPLRVPEHIVPAIAEAITLRFQTGNRLPREQLLDYLRCKQLLLVLDNFEQLAAGTELILELLQECPGLRLLVTSREHLQLNSERLFVLESMALPPTATLPDVLSYSAIQLFMETACRLRPTFTPTAANVAAILQICQLVGGMPLGIILAATWIEVLSPAEIVTELSQSFDFLATELRDLPERQRSMRAIFDHSWKLLSQTAQQVMCQLSIFRGGFTREAAAAVTGASLPTLAGLMARSLLRRNEQGYYDLHELVRQYAAEKLREGGEEEKIQQRHLRYFLGLAEEAALHLRGIDQATWLAQLAVEHSNLRTALTWALTSQQPDTSARLGIALWRFWYTRSYYEEGWQWIAQLLDVTEQPAQRANLLYAQGMLARRRGDSISATDCFTRSLVLFHQLADQRGIASALRGLGFVHYYRGDYAAARARLKEALSLFRALDDLEGIAVTMDNLAHMASDPEEALRLYEESLSLRRRLGNLHDITMSLAGLAYCAINQADYVTARRYLQEHQQINETLGNHSGIAYYLLVLGQVAFAEGNITEAQQLYQESLRRCEESNERWILPFVVLLIGAVSFKQGDDDQARCHFERSLTLYYEAGALPDAAKVLGYFARLTLKQGDAQRSLSLSTAATTLFTSLPFYYLSFEQAEFEQAQMVARQSLNAEEGAVAWATGQQMTLAEAVAYALQRSLAGCHPTNITGATSLTSAQIANLKALDAGEETV